MVIKAVMLKTYAIAADGSAVRINLVDERGETCQVEASIDCLKCLALETPKMMVMALAALYGTPCRRLVHNVESCTVERAEQSDMLILNFITPGGFALSFALPQQELLDISSGIERDDFDEYRELYGVH